jgi:hypothetical protein
MKVWDGSAWQTVAPFSEHASCYVGPDAPAGTAYAGDLWWDTDDPTIAYPGAELAYNQITASVNVTATTAATAQVVVEGTTRTYDGSPVIVEFFGLMYLYSGVSSLVVNLWDGSTDLGYWGQLVAAAGTLTPARLARRITPTVGSHNYRAMGTVNGGTGQVFGGVGSAAGVYQPAFIRVTRV